MIPVVIRQTVIGDGRTKIVVPVAERTSREILARAEEAALSPADAVEWRADHFDGVQDAAALADALRTLRGALGDLPLLFTLRTAREGGAFAGPEEAYVRLCRQALRSGAIDLIDLEPSAFAGEQSLRRLIGEAHGSRVAVVGSFHDFRSTPDRALLLERLRAARAAGADIAKLAVMPRSRQDVLTLLNASAQAAAELDCPVVTISMGQLGVVSRIACRLSGSAMTFAALGSRGSAPGQLEAGELRRMLDRIESEA